MGGRPFRFVYFGGGTPSFLSSRQLERLVDRLRANVSWDAAEEVTFECEPGTLSEAKIKTLREIGVTRLSLGVEHFDDDDSPRERPGPRVAGNLPRLAVDPGGRLCQHEHRPDRRHGRRDSDKWRDAVRRTIELEPDSVTIYQMELPFNTVYSKDILGGVIETPVADWPTKRAWVDYAFDELAAAGYSVSSAYTMVKHPEPRELQLPRQSLARQRSVGHRHRQLRPHLGRPLSESSRVGAVLRHARSGRVAARPRAGDHAPSAAGARDDSAAQDAAISTPSTSTTSSASISSTTGTTRGPATNWTDS